MIFFRIVNVEKRVDELLNIYHLKDEFGLLEEYEYGNYFISLVSLDLDKRSLKKFHTVECYGTNICKNEADPFTFLIRDNTGFPNEWFSRICKIVEKKIIFDDTAETNFYPDCFYDKHIYGLKWYYEEGEELDVSLLFICIVNTLNILDTPNL
jgi:spore coat polysaccharide biosynthesis predicted glycosyltransferase SpsG